MSPEVNPEVPPEATPEIPPPYKGDPHLTDCAINKRGFTWEVIKELYEKFYLDAFLMNDVKAATDSRNYKNRMVLQFQQDTHFYCLIFEPEAEKNGPRNKIAKSKIITMFYSGTHQKHARCPAHLLDGSYPLPTRKIRC